MKLASGVNSEDKRYDHHRRYMGTNHTTSSI